MRLHTLEVSAFLAFPRTERVDFDELGKAGLFLLQGRTGAGKTALLDAVCFAFYGEVPGARQESARLRSDHARDDVVTEVVLEATLRGRRVRVTRAPEQERPKVRGEGTTTVAHRVSVVALDADGETVLATRHDEAKRELGDLLGMTKEQFCQVVLLPQGGFAKFLQARTDQREALLRELFDVGRFAYVEWWLKDRRDEAARALDATLQAVRDVVSQAKQAAGTAPPEGWETAGWDEATSGPDHSAAAGPRTVPAWLDEQLVVAEAQATTARGAFSAAGERREATATALVAARELAARQADLARARAALAEWEAQRPARDEAEARLDAGRRAAPVHPHAVELDLRAAALTEADAAASTALAAAQAAGATFGPQVLPGFEEVTPADIRAAAMRHAAGDLRSEAGAAQAMLPREAALEAASRALDQLRDRAAGHAEAVATQQSALTVAIERRPQLEAAVAAGRDAAARLPGAQAAAKAAKAAAEAGAERDELLARLDGDAGLRVAVLSAREAAVEAAERHAELLRSRLDGIAAELAGRLVDGEACAVCGAVEHPSPATAPDAGLITEEQVRIARQAADKAVAAKEARTAELADLEQRLAEARARIAAQPFAGVGDSPGPTPGAFTRAVSDADPDLAALRRSAAAAGGAEEVAHTAAKGLADAERALTALDRSRTEIEERVSAARESATESAAKLTERATQLRAEQEAIELARAGHPTITARIERLLEAAELAGTAADALDEAGRCTDEHVRASERALAAARRADFADLEALRAALLGDAEVAQLTQAVRDYDEQLTQRRAAATRTDLVEAGERPVPDVAAAEAEQAQAIAAADQAHSTLNEAARRHEALGALRGELATAIGEAGPAGEHHAVLRELADLANGRSDSNRLKMRLSAYVLAARLEEVAAAATVRLAQMSGGRYALEHADDGAKGRSRGGLDLRVLDSWTGRDRAPSTLSGGETFLASLALALGLADVVTAEAGGAALETLFVDEGFGSLDDEGTLDEVLDVLDSLRDGGRAVGIVSHVPELRQRIPMQLRVEKGRDGSHVVTA